MDPRFADRTGVMHVIPDRFWEMGEIFITEQLCSGTRFQSLHYFILVSACEPGEREGHDESWN